MKINVVKRKAASNRELSHAVYELSQERKYTKEQAWDILEQDFSDGLFRVFFNGEEYTNLTDVLDVQEENELVIIRLIMMAGRLW